MEDTAFFLLMLLEVLVAGGLLLLYPRIVRRGLLFGVYVGEQVWQGEAARAITRSWYLGMIACLVLSVVAGTACHPDHPLDGRQSPAVRHELPAASR